MQDPPPGTRTLDLASTLEVGSGGTTRASGDASSTSNTRSVLTIAFQFSYENHLRESVAAMARQYVRTVVASVQRVAMAIAPSRQLEMKQSPGSPEAETLARWIGRSYR
jgi:homeobox-leucine zipper protein